MAKSAKPKRVGIGKSPTAGELAKLLGDALPAFKALAKPHDGRTSDRSVRRGITLVDVLIVIAVVSTLVLLLVAVIPQMRENARRAQCANNMKQIGLGLLDYESRQKHLPGSAEVIKSDPQRPVGGWSFLFKILPNMEYDTIYNSINPGDIENTVATTGTLTNSRTSDGTASASNGRGLHAISIARDTGIAEFLCPSNPNQVYENPQAPINSTSGGVRIAVNNYKAIASAFGPGFCSKDQYLGTPVDGGYPGLTQCDGGLYPTNDGVRLAELSDGASCTILCGETMDHSASAWIAGQDCNMVAIPTLTPPTGLQFGGSMTVNKYMNSFYVLYGEKRYNGQYYDAGLATCINTFFSCEFGPTGYDHGRYAVEMNPNNSPIQARGVILPATGITTGNISLDALYGPSSGHPSVINCLFGDGSVRGVRKDVDAQALFEAITRNNSDPDATGYL